MGNCNGTHLGEMNINYTWRMINGFHDDSYNPEEELWGTDDYSLKITTIYCCGPNASNKLKVISEVI